MHLCCSWPRPLQILGGALFLGVLATTPALAAPAAYRLDALDAETAGGCARARHSEVADELVLDSRSLEYAGWLRTADRITFALRDQGKGRYGVSGADVEGERAIGEVLVEGEVIRLELRAGHGPCRAGSYRWKLAPTLSGASAEDRRDRFALLFALRREVEQSSEARPQSYQQLPDSLAETVALTQALLGAEHPETLLARAYRAVAFTLTQRTAEGFAELEKVLAEQTQLLAPQDHDLLRSRQLRIEMLVKLNRSADAKAEALALVADAQRSLEDRHPLRWGIVASLARRHLDASDYVPAGELAEKAHARLAELLGEDHLETMALRRNIANIQRIQFHEPEAIAVLEALLRVQTERLGPEHLQTLSTADSLSRAYYQGGRWPEGLPLAERNRAIAVREFPPGDSWRRSATNYLGWLYRELGRYADAEALLRETLLSGIKELGESHPTVIDSRSQYALALMARKRYAAAYAEADLAYRLARGSEGENTHHTLWMRSVRVQTLGKLDRCEEVISEARAANEGLRRLHGADTMFANPNEVAGARCASRLGRHAQAIPSLKALYAKLLRLGPNLKLGHLVVLGELGDAHRRAGLFADAAKYYAQLVEEGELARETVGPIEEYRQGFFDRWAIYYRRLADARVWLGEPEDAFSAVEKVKGRGLLEALSMQSADGADLLTSEESTRLRTLRAELGRQEKRAAETPMDSPKRAEVSHDKAQAALRLSAYREELGKLYPKYAQLTRIRLRGSGDAAGLIPADTAFLSYAVVDDEVLVFSYARERGLEARRVAVPGGIAQLVRAYLSFFSRPWGSVKPLVWRLPNGEYRLSYLRPDKAAQEVRSEKAVARRLGRLLLAPAAAALRGKEKWIISPDRSLALLPFEALDWNGERVQQKRELSYIQSLSVLGELREQNARAQTAQSLLAMGDPDYGPDSPGAGDAPARRRTRGGQIASDDSSQQRAWPRLPGSAQEVAQSAKVFPTSQRQVYVRDAASEATLQSLDREGELARYRYLLFATHALLNTEAPQLSSVVLAQNAVTPQANGYVTAVKWANYRLASDMIVLSGCETALGQEVHGEGVTGLPYAMMVAGSRSALLTLWRIDDEFAARFVPRVIAGVKAGLSPAGALSAAKRAMLQDPEFSSPGYWAAFVLYGS